MLLQYLFLMTLPLKLLVASNPHTHPKPPPAPKCRIGTSRFCHRSSNTRLITAGQPIFSIDICDLFGKSWNLYMYRGKRGNRYGCGLCNLEEGLQTRQYYVCLANVPSQGTGQYHCASWDCVTEVS
jgi:hypothetical protein